MTKDTHIAGGLAITMALAMPQGFKELAVCLTAATIGSVISDIDITTSESRRDLNKILIISVVAIVSIIPTSGDVFDAYNARNSVGDEGERIVRWQYGLENLLKLMDLDSIF